MIETLHQVFCFLMKLRINIDRLNMVMAKKYFSYYMVYDYCVLRGCSTCLASIITRAVVDKILALCLENGVQPSGCSGLETDGMLLLVT